MKTIQELIDDKICLRTGDPVRASVSEMIVDAATKLAKKDRREIVPADIVASIRKLIKQNEEAISLIKGKNGNAEKWETELSMLKEFLPPQMTEDECRAKIQEALAAIPEAERTKKAQGRIIGMMKQYENVDLSMVSRILNTIL